MTDEHTQIEQTYIARQQHQEYRDRIAKLEAALRDIAGLESRWGFYLADANTIARKALEE